MNSSGINTAISDTVSETIVKADLLRAFQGCLHRRLTLFQVARDVLDHHNRVIHHETGRDGECHQRQIVEAVAQRIHGGHRTDQRQRHSQEGNHGCVEIAQEKEDHHDDQRDGQHQLKFHIRHGSRNGCRQIGEGCDLNAFRQICLQLRQQEFDGLDDVERVCTWLPLYVQDHCWCLVHPGSLGLVLHTIHYIRNVLQQYGTTVAVGDDDVFVVGADR